MAARQAQKIHRVTLGGRKIPKLLTLLGIGIVEFAKKADVSRVTMRQVIDGQRWRHVTVGFAIRVARASGGMIAVEDFDYSTATPVDSVVTDDGPRRRATGTDG